jgi:hypothetical protein
MEEKKGYSVNQFAALGLDTGDYKFNDKEGVFKAFLTVKAWGKHENLRCFFQFDDDRKIIASVMYSRQYMGFADIPTGARVELTYGKRKDGQVRLAGVKVIDNGERPVG